MGWILCNYTVHPFIFYFRWYCLFFKIFAINLKGTNIKLDWVHVLFTHTHTHKQKKECQKKIIIVWLLLLNSLNPQLEPWTQPGLIFFYLKLMFNLFLKQKTSWTMNSTRFNNYFLLNLYSTFKKIKN